MIYLDNQAATKPRSEVSQAMTSFLKEGWGNPLMPHHVGDRLLEPLRHAYSSLYTFVGASVDDHFVFTSSGAEAINQVIFSTYLEITRKTGKNHYLTTAIDEAPTLLSLERLQNLGCSFHMAPVNKEGIISAKEIAEQITPRTALVSMSWANGLTGVIQPVAEIADVCHERDILFHVDATHVLGKGYFSWKDSGADFLTFNGEQFHGPQGTGGLFFKKDLRLSSFIAGGHEQANFRGGSFSIPNLIGLAKASFYALEEINFICTEIARLKNIFEQTLCHRLLGTRICFEQSDRLPHLSCLTFPGVTSDALLFLLNRRGLYASMGGGSFQQVNHLLKAAGISTHSALSFSLSYETTEEEIEKAITIICEAYHQLRRYSHSLVPL